MKRLLYLLAALSVALPMTMCYKDKSTDASVDMGDISVTSAELGAPGRSVTIAVGSELECMVEVAGVPAGSPGLSYKWQLSESPGSSKFIAIGNDSPSVSYPAFSDLPIDSSPYFLVLTVTELGSGAEYTFYWKLRVASGQNALIVASTADGVTSDITQVVAECFSTQYEGDTEINHNRYSRANKRSINGVVHHIYYKALRNQTGEISSVYLLTDNDMEGVDPGTFKVNRTFSEMFLTPPAPQPKYMAENLKDLFYVNGNDLYSVYKFGSASNGQFARVSNSAPDQVEYSFNAHISVISHGTRTNLAAFDDEKGVFFASQNGYNGAHELYRYKPNPDANNPYDPDGYVGSKAIGSGAWVTEKTTVGAMAGRLNAPSHMIILKNPDGTITFHSADFDVFAWGEDCVYSRDIFTTAACPDIGKAFAFIVHNDYRVVYYITENAVYAATCNNGIATGKNVFTPPDGEKITYAMLFRESWYNNEITAVAAGDIDKEDTMPENNNQLVIATYREGEPGSGKIYALMISNADGKLDKPSNAKTFTGFDKITAMGVYGVLSD